MAFSVGIGLTNECNLRCPHCYRPDMRLDRLTLHDVRLVCESIPVRSMNLGVGENGLHPEYRRILEYLAARGIKTSITSNSASLAMLTDAEVQRFHSVEGGPDAGLARGAFSHLHPQVEPCRLPRHRIRIGEPALVGCVRRQLPRSSAPISARPSNPSSTAD